MELANLIFAVYLVDSLLYTGVKNLDEQNLLLECTFPELPYRMKVLRGVNFEDYFKICKNWISLKTQACVLSKWPRKNSVSYILL